MHGCIIYFSTPWVKKNQVELSYTKLTLLICYGKTLKVFWAKEWVTWSKLYPRWDMRNHTIWEKGRMLKDRTESTGDCSSRGSRWQGPAPGLGSSNLDPGVKVITLWGFCSNFLSAWHQKLENCKKKLVCWGEWWAHSGCIELRIMGRLVENMRLGHKGRLKQRARNWESPSIEEAVDITERKVTEVERL